MKDLNKEGKLALVLIPGVLILVVVLSVLNNRTTREQEMRESMEAAVKQRLEDSIEEVRGYSFQEELDTIRFIGLENIETQGSERARAQVKIGMLDLPGLLKEYLAETDVAKHVEESMDFYMESYEALREDYMERDPYVFEADVEFLKVEENRWEIASEEALEVHSANRDIALLYYGGLQTLENVFDQEDAYREEELLKEEEQELLSFFHRNMNRGQVTVDKQSTEEGYRFALDYQGYDMGVLEEEMESWLLSEFYDGEVRKNNTSRGIQGLRQVMEEFFEKEVYKNQRVKEVTLKKKEIGFALEERRETLESSHEKLREYSAFLHNVEEVPAFFVGGYEEFELFSDHERLRVRRIGEGDGGEIVLYGDLYTGYNFHRWSLREEPLEERTPIPVNREDLKEIKSHQVLDFDQVYHRENLSDTLLPIQGVEGTGFINEKGEVVIEPLKGLNEFAAGDQGISQTHYSLPLVFSVQKEEGEMPTNYAIDDEGEILKDLTHEEVIEIRRGAPPGDNFASEEYAQSRYRLEGFEREGAWGLMLVKTTGGSYHGETETLIEPQYDEIRMPMQNLHSREQQGEPDKEKNAVIAVKGEEEFLINLNNERLSPVDYDGVADFDNTLYQGILTVGEEEGLYDFEENRWIVEPGQEEDELYFLRDDRRRIDREGKIGFKNGENQKVIEPRYQKPQGPGGNSEFYMGYAAVNTEEERLIIDQQETVIYSEARSIGDNPFRITYIPALELLSGGRRVYFTLEGDLIYP